MTDKATPAKVRLTDGLGALVERLRFLASGQDDPHSVALTEAADEIDRLNAWAVAYYKDTRNALLSERAKERARCNKLTDEMLRYAMAALGTGSPAEAKRLRAFWNLAVSARD